MQVDGRALIRAFVLVLAAGLSSAEAQHPGDSRLPVEIQGRSVLAPDFYLTPGEVREDLDQFQRELEERFSYLRANGADYLSAIRAVRERGTMGMMVHDLGIELKKVIALFIDCHAGIGGYGAPKGYLPFQIEPLGDRYVAFEPDRSTFLEARHPFVTAIDGRGIDEWQQIVKALAPKGSPTYVRHITLVYLGYIQFVRQIAGHPEVDLVDVELESEDGLTRISLSLPVVDRHPDEVQWPDSQSRIMEGNIGYLRIKNWDEEAVAEVANWMPRFSATRGLIIDIRDNPGGTRLVLRDLYPYFVTESAPPHVAGAARYRLYSEFGPDHLASRYMFPIDWAGWTERERAVIAEFMETFEPEWVVPEEEFSDWHFWVMSKASNPSAYYYDRPVFFLMGDGNFSASDVILSSVKGIQNVTLIGEPSGGASGAYVQTVLANSELTLKLSSMASFQNTGRLFDGVGVEPDIYMEPEPGYYLLGGPDRILQKAIAIIRERDNP